MPLLEGVPRNLPMPLFLFRSENDGHTEKLKVKVKKEEIGIVQSDKDFLTVNRIAGGIMRKSKINGALTEFKIQRNKK